MFPLCFWSTRCCLTRIRCFACRYAPGKYAPDPLTPLQQLLKQIGSDECLATLRKITANVAQAPAEVKFRKARGTKKMEFAMQIISTCEVVLQSKEVKTKELQPRLSKPSNSDALRIRFEMMKRRLLVVRCGPFGR